MSNETNSIESMARESLELFPEFLKLKEHQKKVAVELFTEKLKTADSDKPMSQANAQKFLKRLFAQARAHR